MNADLARTLREEGDAEMAGNLHADDRTTCFTHQDWFENCRNLPPHPVDN